MNGLQTSYEIHRYFRETEPVDEERHVLVRIINVTDDETRDRIIRATNSQTAIQAASLKATEGLHRSIEDLLKGYSLYYERRKNYYKNRGVAKNRIVGIGYLAQAVTAGLLFQPNTARARPGTLLKNEAEYARAFSEKHPIKMYRVAAELMLRVDGFLSKRTDLSRYERTNYRHHVAAVASGLLRGSIDPSPGQFAALDPSDWDDALLECSLDIVVAVFNDLSSKGGRALDEISKASDVVPTLKTAVKAELSKE